LNTSKCIKANSHWHILSVLIADLPLHLFKTKGTRSYSCEQRQFASTLYYYSPAAYSYVRQHLPIPNPRTIRR